MEENQVTESSPPMENAAEKMFSQAELNRIVGHEKAKAHAAKRELEERYQREMQEIAGKQQQQTERNAQVPRDVDADAIYQQVQERFNREMQERQLKSEMEKVANSYLSKMAEGKNAYEDFEDVTKDFDPTSFPQLTYLVSGMDNASDVIYDLAKNPLKLAALDRLAEKNPKQAQTELLKLSRSITENRKAQAESGSYNIAEPLDRLQPSRVSGSNGKPTIRDLRNQPWLRG